MSWFGRQRGEEEKRGGYLLTHRPRGNTRPRKDWWEHQRWLALRLKRPQSVIVREAIQEYAARTGRLTEEERLHMLKLFDRMIARIPSRPQEEAEAEIAEIRSARRSRGRRTRLE